jgi:hypothetical protein
MKIEYTTGCTLDCIEVEGEPFEDLSATQLQDLKEKLLGHLYYALKSEDDLQELLRWTVDMYGKSEHLSHCDQCGDDIYKTILTI